MYTSIHSYTDTQTHARTRAHTHTHIYTYIRILILHIACTTDASPQVILHDFQYFLSQPFSKCICFYLFIFYIVFTQRAIFFCPCVLCLMQQCFSFPQRIIEVLLPYIFKKPTLLTDVILLHGHQRAMCSTSAGVRAWKGGGQEIMNQPSTLLSRCSIVHK